MIVNMSKLEGVVVSFYFHLNTTRVRKSAMTALYQIATVERHHAAIATPLPFACSTALSSCNSFEELNLILSLKYPSHCSIEL